MGRLDRPSLIGKEYIKDYFSTVWILDYSVEDVAESICI